MSNPETSAYQRMPSAVALAVCIAQTLHQRDGKFLEALRATVDDMYDDVQGSSDVGKALHAFASALDDKKLFLNV